MNEINAVFAGWRPQQGHPNHATSRTCVSNPLSDAQRVVNGLQGLFPTPAPTRALAAQAVRA